MSLNVLIATVESCPECDADLQNIRGIAACPNCDVTGWWEPDGE